MSVQASTRVSALGRGGCATKGVEEFDGGFCVLELPSREAAVHWAAKIAAACRCAQELREFGYDPES